MRAAKSAVRIVPYGTSNPIIHPTHEVIHPSEVISLRYMLKSASAAKHNYLTRRNGSSITRLHKVPEEARC